MLSIGIVGLPNVGKSTLFNALTGSNILTANYPFATIEPNTGIVPIPDQRLDKLAKLYNSKKIVPATVTFVDIAGLVSGASQGEGLGNQFLSHIRTTNAIVQVVRAFKDDNVVHVDNTANPKRDIDIINTELVLADLQTIDRRLPKMQKEARANPRLRTHVEGIEQAQRLLDSGTPIFAAPQAIGQDCKEWLQKELQLLTLKPIIYVFNLGESGLNDQGHINKLRELVAPARSVFICAKLESELTDLDPADGQELLASYGQTESGLVQLIQAAYDTLGLQSYLTAGEKEVRAWSIPKDATAPQAAGVIHGDFKRGFIAAQIVSYPDLIATGSEAAARAAGKIRTEGKNYIMQPNDIVEFRFSL